MCAGPVWTLTGPSRGCWSPVPVRILPCLPWTCHAPSGEYATSFLCAVWLLFPTKTEFFVWYCSLFWAQCLCQAFKEVKRQLFCVHVHMFVFCVSCFVFFLFVLLLGSLVQFMHTLHSLYRGQLHQLSSIINYHHTKNGGNSLSLLKVFLNSLAPVKWPQCVCSTAFGCSGLCSVCSEGHYAIGTARRSYLACPWTESWWDG